MSKKQFDLSSMSRRGFMQSAGAAALVPMIPDLAFAQAGPGAALATSAKGMVTSPHELATQAGLKVLQSGGNAIEAVIAISSCLSVTYPHFSGYGGDAFMIISDANGKAQTISGIGQAPQDISGYSGSIPFRGPKSMLTSAAYVDTLGKAYEISKKDLKGKKSWSSLLSPAIKLAKDGFPVTASEVFWLNFRMKEMGSLPGVESGYLINGKVPTVGEIFKQPKLAKTIEMIAERGHRDFYEGKLAAILAQGLKDAGSPLTAKDLALTQAQIEPPLTVAYRGGTLLGNQPPTQAITTLEIMGILERFDLSKIPEGSPDYYHLLVEAVKLAFIDRNKYVADPKFVDVPVQRLLSDAYLDQQAKKVSMSNAMPWPYVYKQGDTVYLAAVDSKGNCASMLTTVYYDWGSGVQVGDTGMLWHNRGASFSLDPKSRLRQKHLLPMVLYPPRLHPPL